MIRKQSHDGDVSPAQLCEGLRWNDRYAEITKWILMSENQRRRDKIHL